MATKKIASNNCPILLFHKLDDKVQLTFNLLYKTYSNVVHVQTESNVIPKLRELQKENKSSPILLLIDAESCVYKFPEECPTLLTTTSHLLRQNLIHNVVLIVCSIHDSPSFMVKCLQEGAADYILKPLSEDIVKTLFLNVARYSIQHHKKNLNQIENYSSKIENMNKEGQVGSKFKGRFKVVFSQDFWIPKAIINHYLPKSSTKGLSVSQMLNERVDYLKDAICSWNFLPLDLDDKDLIQCVFMILNQVLLTFDQLKTLRVPNDELYHFIFDIYNSYHSANPYHNFRHAVDVLQANYYFLCQIGALKPMSPKHVTHCKNPNLKRLLEPLDIFALLMASIGHDVGHPGVNNNFMINTSSPLAILYNDKSVLESFHTMSFFHLLREHCFSQLTDPQLSLNYSGFRKIVVNSILATDMMMHEEYVEKIKDQAIRFKEGKINFNDKLACENEKILLCCALIKCADISNCARPFESARRWALVLSDEFCEQGDLERELKLPVLPINDRGKIPLTDFQLSFKKFVAIRLFDAVSQLTLDMKFTVDQINENIAIWENIKKKEQEVDGLPLEKKNSVSNNNLLPLPSLEGKSSTSQRSRSGI